MLLNVHIKNLALIDDIHIDFTDQLNILTGETGAGKSILIGALKIGMGEKLPKDLLRDPDKEGLCQLLFLVEDAQVLDELAAIGVYPSEDGELIITRRMLHGRTVNTINGETVTAAKLKETSAFLVDLHAQHEQQTLLKRAEHLKILDQYGKKNLAGCKAETERLYKAFTALKRELESLQMDEGEKNRKIEYLKYELSEIEAAGLRPGEDEALEKKYHKMVHAREIIKAASDVYRTTGYTDSASSGNEISRALTTIRNVKDLDPDLKDIYDQLSNVDALLNDFNVSLNHYMLSMEFDDAEFEEICQRLDLINHLKGKYGNTLAEITGYQKHLETELARLEEYDSYVTRLSEECSIAGRQLEEAADRLTAARKKAAEDLCGKIKTALLDLNFPEVRFDMVFDRLPECGAAGRDDCYFIISTNIGEKEKPLYEIASGGELSRIMLAVKSCMAAEDKIDTLIFDEIDVGISGRTAQKVSEKLAVIAKNHQVISITHLPQIAAMADSHYLIEKTVEQNKTVTNIRRLDEDGSIAEIARLLGGNEITETAMLNAKEMKDMAAQTKTH